MTRDSHLLVAGLGSIGRRHVANLRRLGWSNVRLFRTGTSTLPDDDLQGLPVVSNLDEALEARPLAVLVCNPTALHMPVARAAAATGAHLFLEKPIAHDWTGVLELTATVAREQLTVLVGFQFRFNPALRQIKAWLDAGEIGDVISMHAHWGEFLPEMHPWEDHRIGYAARRDLGGGVLLTLCHPFDYLRWLVGDISRVDAAQPRHSPLGLAVDTSVDVLLEFATGATGHVHLNFVQRPTEHRLTIVGTHGTATWNQADETARLWTTASSTWTAVPPPDGFERNRMFLDEMSHFLACLRGESEPRCSLFDGIQALGVVLSAKEALRRSAPTEGAA